MTITAILTYDQVIEMTATRSTYIMAANLTHFSTSKPSFTKNFNLIFKKKNADNAWWTL